jgi:CRP/FNR family transcriptional regulator
MVAGAPSAVRRALRQLQAAGKVAIRDDRLVVLAPAESARGGAPATTAPHAPPAVTRDEEEAGRTLLRRLFLPHARRFAFDYDATRAFVEGACIRRYDAGAEIADEPGNGAISFLLSGAVRFLCEAAPGKPVWVDMVRPGQFIISGLIAHLYGGAPLFHAVAHVPSEVATIGIDALAEVIRRLSPTAVVRLTSYSWRILSAHIHQKSVALTLPLRHRLLYQLRILADRFPQEHPRGTLIDLPLIHEDLAHFVVSRRENVCRMLRALEGAGLVGYEGRRMLVLGYRVRREIA